MKVEAKNFDDYFIQAGAREGVLREIDALIRESAPGLNPVLFRGMGGGVALGYGMQPYRTKSMKKPGKWPLIVLANQKHHVSLYICAIEDGKYIAEKNADRLGKVSVGKSCIRFKSQDDINLNALRDIIEDIDRRVTSGEKLFGI